MRAIPTKFPSLDANAKKDPSLMPKNRIIRSVYDYLPTYEEVEDDDASTGQWDNRTTDSTAERIIGSIALASKSEIDRSQPYQRVATPPSPVIRAHKDLAKEIRDNEKHKKQGDHYFRVISEKEQQHEGSQLGGKGSKSEKKCMRRSTIRS